MFSNSIRISKWGGLMTAAFVAKVKQNNNHDNSVEERLFSPIREFPSKQSSCDFFDVNAKLTCTADDPGGSSEKENSEVEEPELLELAEVLRPNEKGRQQAQSDKLKAAVAKANNLCFCKLYECGSPGLVVGISVNGKTVWQHGFGYADLENKLLCGTGAVMRIASISKPITATVLARLWEQGKVDLDAPISTYVADWPVHDGAEMTLRHLLSHMAGVRHYTRKGEQEPEEFENKEYYLNTKFKSIDHSLDLFKNDELLAPPGQEFHYSTHGFTIIAKVIEKVTGESFEKYMEKQFKELGMTNTFLDRNDPIIYNRAKSYVRDSSHRLLNAPYVDNSYKWAGGGFLSTVGDLLKFGNAMLYSSQQHNQSPRTENGGQANTGLHSSEGSLVKRPPSEEENSVNKGGPETTSPTKEEKSQSNGNRSSNTPEPCDPDIQTDPNKSPREELPSPPTENPEVKTETETEDASIVEMHQVVYHPGPYAAVNQPKTAKQLQLPGFLKRSTVRELWSPQAGAELPNGRKYGLGWSVRPGCKEYGYCRNDSPLVYHTGAAVGVSSVLLIMPEQKPSGKGVAQGAQGVVVAIMANMQSVNLTKLAEDIAMAFKGLELEQPAKVQKVYQC